MFSLKYTYLVAFVWLLVIPWNAIHYSNSNDAPLHANVPFAAGWFLSGTVVLGDIQDTVYSAINLDALGFGLNLVAFAPAAGDALKAGKIANKLTSVSPKFVIELSEFLAQGLKTLDSKIEAIRQGYKGATKGAVQDIISDFTRKGVKEEHIIKVAENRGDLAGTLHIASNLTKTKVVWLENGLDRAEAAALGKTPTGWKHIFEDHVKNLLDTQQNQFAKAFGSRYTNAETIQELIMESAERGKTINSTEYYLKIDEGHYLLTAVGDNGYILTSYPQTVDKIPLEILGLFT